MLVNAFNQGEEVALTAFRCGAWPNCVLMDRVCSTVGEKTIKLIGSKSNQLVEVSV